LRTSTSTTWSKSCQRHCFPRSTSSAGDGRCCKCSTCTCECHKKISSPGKIGPLHLHLHPHLGTTTCRRNTLASLYSLGSSRTTRLIRHVVIKFLNSLRHVRTM
jgi:hypothetical protein